MNTVINIRTLIFFIVFLPFYCLATKTGTVKISVKEYQDKVYAAWLGQCIGNFVGLPHENQHIENPGSDAFPLGYTGSINRMKEVNGAFSDDDTDIEYMYLMAMEKYGTEPTYAQITESWLNHIKERVWLANRAALSAMRFGYTPPVTGMKAYNPHWFQIDPQLVNEIWGITAPGMIQYASQKSDWFARITDDSWGTEPTIHYGAMFSAAFFESDIHKLIDIGTSALPTGSRFAQTVEDMKALYAKYPNDWKQARKEMANKYYYKEPVDTRTIWNANLNGASGILALLYGNGDFQKTLYYACLMGFDADNQAATMCGLIAAINGTKVLPEKYLYPFPELNWKEPFNDLYKNVSRDNMTDASIKDMAQRTVQQAEKIILANGGQKVTENGEAFYIINTNAVYNAPLELPNGRLPVIIKGKPIDFTFPVSGNKPICKWSILSGKLPDGLVFNNGKLSGIPKNTGIYTILVKVEQEEETSERVFNILVRGENYAESAKSILSNVTTTSASTRDSMWVSISPSMFAKDIHIINDGKINGDGSVFYSIKQSFKQKNDYYGYEWKEKKRIGLIGFHTGSMEEFGGWFRTLNVEYQDDHSNWKSVAGLKLTPGLVNGDNTELKPDFVEYLISFTPVSAKAIRIIGEAGGGEHWFSKDKTPYFTSITELSVHEPLPGIENISGNTSVKTSFTGMKTQEITVGNTSANNVLMAEETIGLNDLASQSIIYIDQLDLSNAEQDDYPIGSRKNVKGNPIQLNHIKYERGLGTYTNSMLHINLNKGSDKFMATVGFDDEVLGQGCHPIEFIVYADDKVVWRSGAMKPTDAPKQIEVNLKGKSILTLYVKSVRGKWNGFSAWADAKLEVIGEMPKAFERKKEVPYLLTPLAPDIAQINGPDKVGVHPGAPFQYYIPVTGKRPIRYEIANLPDGLSLDPATGIISGKIVKRGTYKLLLKAKNKEGLAQKPFSIEVGDTLALTPPMGWNSWNVWAVNVSQEKVLAAANAIKTSGLIDYGWNYVNIDDGWQGSIRGGKWNSIQPNQKFPDMKGLCDYIHGLGLKAGIYSTPWDRTYAQFIGSSSDCEDGTSPYYSKDIYRIEFGFYPFYKQDTKQWAEWGFDYLKLDWFPNTVSHTIEFRKALDETGRDFVYSLSNAAPIEQASYWEQHSNLWRTTGDIVDSWGSIYAIATEQQEKWSDFGGPGHWNDPDMLVVGWLGWGKDLHYTRLTPTEQYSHVSLWALMSAPLLLGADLTQLEPFTFNLLSNSEVIAINQDILGGKVKQIKIDDLIEIWVKDLSDGSKAVGLCNFGVLPHDIKLKWTDLEIDGTFTVRDVWRQKNMGNYSGSFESEVLPHGVKLIKLTKKQ